MSDALAKAHSDLEKARAEERKANMALVFGTIDNDAHKKAVRKRKAAEAVVKVEETQ